MKNSITDLKPIHVTEPKTKNKQEYFKYAVFSLSVVFLMFIWQIASLLIDREVILPGPFLVLQDIVRIIRQKSFFLILSNTFYHIIAAFMASFILALVTGVAAGICQSVYYALLPVIIVLKSVLSVAIILIVLIWFGNEHAPIIVSFVVVYPVLFSNIYHGITNTDEKLIEMARIYQIPQIRVIREIYIPSISNYIFAGLNAALGLTFKVTIATELIGLSKNSIGSAIYWSRIQLNTTEVFSWTILIIIFSEALDKLILLFYRLYKKYIFHMTTKRKVSKSL